MNYEVSYKGNEDRQRKIAYNEAAGLEMLHDTFDPDYKPFIEVEVEVTLPDGSLGVEKVEVEQEPFGVMLFTDVHRVAIPAPPVRDLASELDSLKAKVQVISDKVGV